MKHQIDTPAVDAWTLHIQQAIQGTDAGEFASQAEVAAMRS